MCDPIRKLLVIGIGAGDPDQLTLQAVKALNRADVVFLLDKGADKAALAALRREICGRHIAREGTRFVEAAMPERGGGDYRAAVAALNRDKAALFRRLVDEALAPGQTGAFLVWGDPALYDSTLRNLRTLTAGEAAAFAIEVIPGISSVQALAARHRLTLTGIAEPLLITTGRRLAEGWPAGVATVIVMLDAGEAYRACLGEDLDIYWGAYVGMPGEILIAGRLAEVADEIARVRRQARAAHGWIMDSYVLRRRGG